GHMALFPRWRDTWGDLAERISALVVITITEVGDVTTPPYDDGVSEMDMVAIYKAKYAEYYP
ncbi:MAG: pyridoxamine 5'-phosphate oxidase family protein, partial [Paracoccaceae bacterium]